MGLSETPATDRDDVLEALEALRVRALRGCVALVGLAVMVMVATVAASDAGWVANPWVVPLVFCATVCQLIAAAGWVWRLRRRDS